MRKFFTYSLLCFVLFISANKTQSQIALTQLSGFVSDADTGYPLPFTGVRISGTWRAVVANSMGFFSIAVAVSDTIEFSTVGYESKKFIVPDSIQSAITSIGVFLQRDTILLRLVEIYPWPSKDEFKKAFVGIQLVKEKEYLPIFGIRGVEDIDTIPKEPTIFQPISLLYEQVIVPLEYKRKKRNMAKILPKWE